MKKKRNQHIRSCPKWYWKLILLVIQLVKEIKHLSCREHFTIYEFTNTSYRPNVLLFIIVYYHFRTTDNINIIKSRKCFVGPMMFEEKIFFSINQKKTFLYILYFLCRFYDCLILFYAAVYYTLSCTRYTFFISDF